MFGKGDVIPIHALCNYVSSFPVSLILYYYCCRITSYYITVPKYFYHTSILILLFCCLHASNIALCQEYLYYTYNTRNGLPSNRVKAVSEDNQGNIWIPTEKGITKFDGKNFKTFTVKDGLPTNDIFFATAIGDTCWIYDYSPYVTYILRDSVHTIKIEQKGRKTELFHKKYFSVGNGRIYSSNRQNTELITIDDGSCTTIDVRDFIENIPALKSAVPEACLQWHSLANYTSVSITTKKFVIAFEKKLVVYDLNTREVTTHIVDTPVAYNARQPDIQSQIFSDYFLYTYDKPHILHFINLNTFEHTSIDLKAYHPNYKASITHLIEGDTVLKITSSDNFYFEIDKHLAITDTFQWYPDQKINNINKDKSGNYWISTNNEGLHMVQHHLLNFKIIPLPFETSNILGLHKDADKFFLFDDQSNLYLTNNKFQLIKKIHLPVVFKSYPELSAYWFFPDHGYGYYIASAFGIYYLTSDFRLKTIQNLHSESCKDYCYNPATRNLIVATNYGIHRIAPYSLIADKNTKCPPYTRIMQIEKVENGYMGTNDFGRVMHFNSDFALVSDISLNKNIVFSAVDEDNMILALESEGIYSYNPATNNYRFIAEDDNIQYYTGVNDGFWVANYQYICKRSYSRNKYKIKQKYLNTKGLLYNEIYSIADLDSTAYLLCDNGIIQLPGDDFSYKDAGLTPGCHPYNIVTGNHDYSLSRNDSSFSIDYSGNSITIKTTCNSTSFLGEISTRYYIEEESKEWTNAENGVINFPKLLPGSYKIHLKAVVKNSDFTSNETVFTLHILPRWWQTMFLKISIGLILVALIVLIYFLRIRRIKEKARREIALDKKVSELELSALQSQMNPHFIFNSLTSIQSFINTHSTEAADNLLQKFSMLVRNYLDFSRKSDISLRQELKALKLYTEIETLRFNNKFNVEYHLRNTSNKTLDQVRIIPMLIQPLVENAINHGLYHLEGRDGVVKIFFLISNKNTLIVVDDNGVGRSAAMSLRNKLFPAIGNSLIKDRIAIINQSKRASITMDIIDKTKQDGKPAGTRIIMKIKTEQ